MIEIIETEMEMRIMENVTEDHGAGHLHVKYLPDSIIEIFKIFDPDLGSSLWWPLATATVHSL